MIDGYVPKTFYLLDVSGDGRMDIIVWGSKPANSQELSENCLVPFIRTDNTKEQYDFVNKTKITTSSSADPIVIGHQFNG